MAADAMVKYEQDAEYRRACAEEQSYELQKRLFYPIFSITPTSTKNRHYKLGFRDWYTKQQMRPLEQLTIDDCRLFCWKDCAIYDQTAKGSPTASSLLHAVWQEWYPHRAMDKDIYDDSFFAKNMTFSSRPETLETIFRFHETLCARLKEIEPNIPELKPLNYFSRWGNGPVLRSDYKIRQTFLDVFLVLDSGWEESGVLVCWISPGIAAQHNLKSFTTSTEEYEDLYGTIPEGRHVLRCSLPLAMRIVVSKDPKRKRSRGRYTSEHLQDIFGQGLDDDDDDAHDRNRPTTSDSNKGKHHDRTAYDQ